MKYDCKHYIRRTISARSPQILQLKHSEHIHWSSTFGADIPLRLRHDG